MKENRIDFNSSVRPNRKKHLVDLTRHMNEFKVSEVQETLPSTPRHI